MRAFITHGRKFFWWDEWATLVTGRGFSPHHMIELGGRLAWHFWEGGKP